MQLKESLSEVRTKYEEKRPILASIMKKKLKNKAKKQEKMSFGAKKGKRKFNPKFNKRSKKRINKWNSYIFLSEWWFKLSNLRIRS